mmetsp:Transcript_14997/g.28226  ORF Transcript_14997/g.28226 Transcript_14997/m.28226 type:complete len:143 (-) Transcript_14997:1602-2030(-)
MPHVRGSSLPMHDPSSENVGDHSIMEFDTNPCNYQSEDEGSTDYLSTQDANKMYNGATINEMGYGKTNTILKEISKCNSVQSSDWDRLEDYLKSFLHQMKNKDSDIVPQSVTGQQEQSLVSSHAPIEKSPNRRRYRAFYERK